MLDSKHLTDKIINSLKEIPLDAEAMNDRYSKDITLQTKIDIYDANCGTKCGFCRIECRPPIGKTSSSYFSGTHRKCVDEPIIFGNIEDALQYALLYDADIKRTCEYPGNIVEIYGKSHYPSVSEIVSNGCRFWYPEKLEADEIEEVLITQEIVDAKHSNI